MRTGSDDTSDMILTAEELTIVYRSRGKSPVRAVDRVDLTVRRGETLGLVGESGSGKSSIGKALVQLPSPTSGRVRLADLELTSLKGRRLREARRRIQMIFQDPISSLNPRRTAQQIVAEPLRIAKREDAMERALEVLAEVGVDAQMAQRRPHELSGGQCQRVSIARALVQEPEMLICDEPVSALDVSVQAQVLNLLERTKAEHDLSMVFISHDLAVVSNISDRVAVLYLGRLCELAPAQTLYAHPRHPYTNLLLSSIPDPERERTTDTGPVVRSRPDDQAGCQFAPRCPAATDLCRTSQPEFAEIEPGHFVACHHMVPVGAAGDRSLPVLPTATLPRQTAPVIAADEERP
ncbi:ABC transporter ATP-binding protein [Streptomyces sp. NPDC005507]|uniref:ABC transporter ATP-binding protein n=1 Tax=unclassified Streptomyces TaxID=2593676 RepID=UPI0033A4FB22